MWHRNFIYSCKTGKKILLIGLKSFWRDLWETVSSLLISPFLFTLSLVASAPSIVLCSSLNRACCVIIERALLLYPGSPSFIPLPHSKDLFIFQSLLIGNRIISSIRPLSDSTASSYSLLPSPPTTLWAPRGRDQALHLSPWHSHQNHIVLW